MAAPNIQELTSRLATMSDAQMQQYAQMHKDDPYVLSMAVSEKGRRAAMRSAAQPQQQQPTVADAEIGGMAPAGLSALPAQNMESMDTIQAAGGGILGFQNGGMFEIPEMLKETTPEVAAQLAGRGETDATEEKRLLPAFWEALTTGKTVAQVRGQEAPAPERSHPMGSAAAPKDTPDPAANVGGLGSLAASMKGSIEATADTPSAGIAALAAPAQEAAPAAAVQAPAQKAAAAPKEAVSQTKAKPEDNIAARLNAALQPARDAGDALVKRADLLSKEQMADARAELVQYDQRNKNAKPVGSEREARLQEQQDGLFSMEGQALGNAAMRGFLAILGGTSRSSRVNIARGLAVGLNSFDKRMAQVEQRRMEINKNLNEVEQLREQASAASAEKRDAIEARIRTVRGAGAQRSIDLATSLGFELEKAAGVAMFDSAERTLASQQKQTWESGEKAKDRAAAAANNIRSTNASRAVKAPKEFDLDKAYADYYAKYREDESKSSIPLSQPLISKQQYAMDQGLLPTAPAQSAGAIRPRN
jgi:hypothetical protein